MDQFVFRGATFKEAADQVYRTLNDDVIIVEAREIEENGTVITEILASGTPRLSSPAEEFNQTVNNREEVKSDDEYIDFKVTEFAKLLIKVDKSLKFVEVLLALIMVIFGLVLTNSSSTDEVGFFMIFIAAPLVYIISKFMRILLFGLAFTQLKIEKNTSNKATAKV